MKKFAIALFGIVLLFITINFRGGLVKSEKEAVAKDKEKTSYGFIEGPLPCKWNVDVPERVISENKSQAIVVKVTNETDDDCASTISLHAPGFDISPVKEDQTINLKSKNSGSISWIISPRKIGTYEISVSDTLNTKIFGITVTNMFGLSAVQAKSASFVGTLFGPMLTIPWWWEKWFQNRKKQDPPQKPDQNPAEADS